MVLAGHRHITPQYTHFGRHLTIKHTRVLFLLYTVRQVRDSLVRPDGLTVGLYTHNPSEAYLSLLVTFPEVNLDALLVGVCREGSPRASALKILLKAGANAKAHYMDPLKSVIESDSIRCVVMLLNHASYTYNEISNMIRRVRMPRGFTTRGILMGHLNIEYNQVVFEG